ncbi:MAG: hypothetical protein JWS12_786 [Candidatus Saccharibacteria bacterium]|nr:hypothetical protein [Candidatus Saccharibacteria bacterium]
MTHENQPQETLDFTPMEWTTATNLIPGTVLRLSHELTEDITYFECTGINGGKVTAGIMTIMHAGEPEPPVQATINSYFLAQQNTHHVEFTIISESSTTTIWPAFTHADKAFDALLAQEVLEAEQRRIFNEQFGSHAAQDTLIKAVTFLFAEANQAEDSNQKTKYATAATIIAETLLQ